MSYLKKIYLPVLFTLFTISPPIYSSVKVEGVCLDNGKPKSAVLIKVIKKDGVFETMSNLNGGFSLNTQKGDVIQFSFGELWRSFWIDKDDQCKMARS